MRPRNKRIYSLDKEYLTRLREEYTLLGFDTSLERGMLTVYALPRKRKRKKKDERDHEPRNKRAEKHARD